MPKLVVQSKESPKGLQTPRRRAIGSRGWSKGRGGRKRHSGGQEGPSDRWEAAKPSGCFMASILCVSSKNERWLGVHHLS